MKKATLMIGLITWFNNLFSQGNLPNVMLPSPTAMQFQKYGDYPVSHFTGVPDISIPIYTINEGDIQVPIYLSYHASGNKSDDVSGFIGLGWTLNTGGIVTRIIKGFPDETKDFRVPDVLAQYIDFTDATDAVMLDDLDEGIYYDHEYDVYSYNFLGKSGKFIIDENVGNVQMPVTDMDIFDFYSAPGRITDANGIQYNFNGATEYSTYTDGITSATRSAPTSWQLGSIQSPTNPSINVNYEYQDGPNFSVTVPVNIYDFDDYWENTLYYHNDNIPNSRVVGSGGLKQTTYGIENPTYVPKQINFQSGTIKFIKDSVTSMLKRIEIYNSGNQLIKKVYFNISSFSGSVGYSRFDNFGLRSVCFTDNANDTIEKYSFKYFNENITYAKPQAYTDGVGRDYWGYYNGYDGNSTRLVSFPGFTTQNDNAVPSYFTMGGGDIRTLSEYSTKAYVLDKITYPTGGYTTFDYESNVNAQSAQLGGLRVKTISSYTDSGKLATEKNYYYYYGISEILPNDAWFITTTAGDIGNGHVYDRKVTMKEDIDLDLSPKGASVVYPTVMETNGSDTSYYNYDTDPAYTYEDLNYPGIHPVVTGGNLYFKRIANNYKPWNFGNLTGKTVESAGSTQSESYEYEEFVKDTLRDFVMQRWMTPDCLTNWVTGYTCNTSYFTDSYDYIFPQSHYYNVFNYADRFYYAGGKRVKKKTTTSQNSAYGVVGTTEEYFYDNPSKPTVATRILRTSSNGDTVITTLKRPYDLPSTAPYDEMVLRNMIGPVVEQIDSNFSKHTELSRSKTNYSFWNNDTLILPSTIQQSLAGNSLTTEVTFNNYDRKGNIRQFTAKDGLPHSFIWDHSSLYPVAEAINADSASVAYTSFEADGKGGWTFSGSSSNSDSMTGSRSYLLSGGNITKSSLASRTYIISYWGKNGSINVNGNGPTRTGKTVGNWTYYEHDVTTTSVTLSDPGNHYIDEVRLYPKDARMSTCTYKPLLGKSSESDANGRIVFYEYDKYNQLNLIKDEEGKILKRIDYKFKGNYTN